ncbi:MAG: hypothetical protein AABW67_03130 [Nanoarchaeota archaeon]
MNKRKIKAQVWIETAVYTLIGITIMGIVLSMAIPQIEKMKDNTIIEQTMSAMNVLNDKILNVEQSEKSVGKVVFTVGKGYLEFDSGNNSIKYVLENTKLELSEPGKEIPKGNNIILKTEKYGSNFNIILKMSYTSNITYEGQEKTKRLNAGGTPYNIFIENKGVTNINSKTQLDFTVV